MDHFDHFSPFRPFFTILDHFGPFGTILDDFRLFLEISSLDAFCDTAAAAGTGIGDSRSWIVLMTDTETDRYHHRPHRIMSQY